jgi:hypothetical protein
MQEYISVEDLLLDLEMLEMEQDNQDNRAILRDAKSKIRELVETIERLRSPRAELPIASHSSQESGS